MHRYHVTEGMDEESHMGLDSNMPLLVMWLIFGFKLGRWDGSSSDQEEDGTYEEWKVLGFVEGIAKGMKRELN